MIIDLEHLSQKLSQVHNSLTKAKRVVEVKQTDMCLLEGLEENLKSIGTNLQGIKRDMLLIDNYESLAGRAGGLEEALFELRVAIKRLLRNIMSQSTVSSNTGLSGVKHPKISVPVFDRRF